jgi:hypothetical protein
MYGGLFSAGHATHNVAASRAATEASHRASHDANKARSETEELKDDVEKLLMITEALWTILKEQLGYDEDELIRRIEEIDMRDGILDGKVKAGINPDCPECGRKLIGKRAKCLYCGVEVKRDLFER